MVAKNIHDIENYLNSINENNNNNNDDNNKNNEKWIRWRIFFLTFRATFGIFCIGNLIGWTSFMYNKLETNELKLQLTMCEFSYVASALPFGAVLSPLIVRNFFYKSSYKFLLIFSAFLMILSGVLIVLSINYLFLLYGRLLGGFGIGIIHYLIPIYINDIATPDNKQSAEYIIYIQFASGILTQYLYGLTNNMDIINKLTCITAIILFFNYLCIPESIRYLCKKNRLIDVKIVLKNLRTNVDSAEVDNEIDLLIKFNNNYDNDKCRKIKVKNFTTYLPLFGLIMLEQFIGVVALFFYLTKIFYLTDSNYSTQVSSIIICVVFLCSIISLKLFKININNRKLLLSTIMMMGLMVFILGIHCHMQGTSGHLDQYKFLSLLIYSLFIYFYTISLYPLTWKLIQLITTEINYFNIRALSISFSWFIISIITNLLPELISYIGVGWFFWYLSFIHLLTIIYILLFLPNLQEFNYNNSILSNSKLVESEINIK